jgi:hypothetical protein
MPITRWRVARTNYIREKDTGIKIDKVRILELGNREWQVSSFEGSFLRLLTNVFGVQSYGERFSNQSLDTSVALMIDEAI